MNVTQALDEYLLSVEADGSSPATLKWYRSILTAAALHFGEQPLSEIGSHHLRAYIVGLRNRTARYVDAPQKPAQDGRLSAATVDAHLTALHAFFAWCAREQVIADNPMSRIGRPRRRQPQPRAISATDFMRIFDATGDNAAGARDRAMLAFLADSGARLGGVIGLTLDNLDLERCFAIVTEKGRRSRRVNFTRYTARLIEQWLQQRESGDDHVFVGIRSGRRLTDSGVNQILKRLKRKAQVTGRVNPHSFRHAFAREYVLNGGDVVTLAKQLGHADINTTAAYYAIFTESELATLHEKYSPLGRYLGA